MTDRPDNSFDGADEAMGAGSLPHAQFVTLPGPLPLHLGGQLDDVQIAYETYGQLNAAKDNAILICHALTSDSHVARHTPDDTLGWWDCLVGPGKHIDTDQYFVICSNTLGGCRGTTGPSSIDPATGQAYGVAFPEVTTEDMVAAQAGLIDALGIDQLRCVVGGSMGGHQAMRWAVMYPNRVRGVIGVATSPRLSSQSLAFDIVGRNAIRHDPQFEQTGKSPQGGLAIARMLGHITYLSSRAMSAKFEATRNQPRDVDTNFEKMFSVGSYLAYKGQQFVERFDANSYLTLSTAMDRFDLGGTPEALRETFAPSTCRWLIISFSDDWLFPEWQSRQMVQGLVDAGKHVSYCNVESQCGHDAFLLEDDLDTYGGLAEAFLKNCTGDTPSCTAGVSPALPRTAGVSPASGRQDAACVSEESQRRERGYLPHWTENDATYAVCFRLADSMPKHVVEGWQAERKAILLRAEHQNRELSESERVELQHLRSERIETYLDSGHGECVLQNPEIAQIVRDAMTHFDGERYELLSWCIMPNHVHAVLRPSAENVLSDILHSWKSFSSKRANKALQREGKLWQCESYDHIVRDQKDYDRCMNYVLNNPANAGLTDWPWVGSNASSCTASSCTAGSCTAGVSPASGRQDACGTEECRQDACGTGELAHAPTSVFGANRLDYARLLDLIDESASVLDLGCGGGGMLEQLASRPSQANLQGVELDEQRILHCVNRGLDVIQGDLNKGLELFSDNHFDIALLSQTLQTIYDVDGLISELLRVGRRTIVSVPNFAYHKLTDMLVGEGRTPEAGLLHYAWFNTPNIRVLTLKDFERYCHDKGITIEQCIALDTEAGQEVPPESDPNRNADMAIFVLSR